MYTTDPQCFICEHFCLNNNDGLLFGCRAFPDGIPDSVHNGYCHNEVVDNKVGDYVFTPRDDNNLTDFAKWQKELQERLDFERSKKT